MEAVHKTPEVFQPVQGHMHQTTPRCNVHMQSTPDLENIVTYPVARPQHQRYSTRSYPCEADILTKAIKRLENKPHTEPLGPLQERFLTCAVKHKLQQSNSGSIICKTGSQPLHFNVIPQARKESLKASMDTLKKRVNVIESHCR